MRRILAPCGSSGFVRNSVRSMTVQLACTRLFLCSSSTLTSVPELIVRNRCANEPVQTQA